MTEEKFVYGATLDDKAIKEITAIIEKVEKDNKEEAMIICHSSVEQTIERAFPDKSVFCPSTDIIPCDNRSVWVIPNSLWNSQSIFDILKIIPHNKGKLKVEYN